MEEIKIRSAKPEDLPLIYATWLKSYKFGSSFAKNIPNDIFFDNHHKVITHILSMTEVKLSIAALSEDENVIIGWFCFQPVENVAQYIFVKKSFRKMGIAKQLFEHSGLVSPQYTHLTYHMSQILPKLPDSKYNPYAI